MSSQPRGLVMSSDGKTVVVACHKEILIFVDQKKVGSHAISYQPMCIALSPDQKYVVVGCQVLDSSKTFHFLLSIDYVCCPLSGNLN